MATETASKSRNTSIDRKEIQHLADYSVCFAPTAPGMTRSNENNWPAIATADFLTISGWLDTGKSLVAVAKEGHTFIIDIDDLAAAKEKGFKEEWLEGYYLVDSPSGGIHAHGVHNAVSQAISSKSKVDVFRVKGDNKSGLVLEFKRDHASCAAPTAERKGQEGKCDGVYRPRTPGGRLRTGLRPELLAWIQENREPETSASHEKFTGFHADFELADFLENEHCAERQSGIVNGQFHVEVEECPHCGKRGGSTLAAAKAKFIFGDGEGYGFICHACGVSGRPEHEQKMVEEYADYEPWSTPIFPDAWDAKNFEIEDVDDVDPRPNWEDLVSGEDYNSEGLTHKGFQKFFNATLQSSVAPPPNTKRLWKTAADQLDEIREGTRLEERADGKGNKVVKIPKHLVDEKVFNYVAKAVMRDAMHAKFFVDAYPYIFLPDEAAIYNFHNEEAVYRLLSRLRLRITQQDYKLVQENLHQEILFHGESTHIEKFGCFKNDAIYVNNGRGGIIKINDTIEDVANGTDGVYMLNKHLRPWPEITPATIARVQEIQRELGAGFGDHASSVGGWAGREGKLVRYLVAYFEQGRMNQWQYCQLVMLRFLSLFCNGAFDLRPVMMATGPQNSGKSTLWEKIMWLLFGVGYTSPGLPVKLRDFISTITNHEIQLFDNIDRAHFDNDKTDYPTYVDLMCKASTGGSISIAQLYKNNIDKNYDLRCNLFLTARVNPFPSHYSDLLRRTLTFPIRMPDHPIAPEAMKAELIRDEEELKLETLARLWAVRRALVENKNKQWEPVSQMHPFENFTMRIADYEGWAEEMRGIWESHRGEYQHQLTEDSPLVNYIRCWLGKDDRNIGRWVRTGQLYQELADRYGKLTQSWRTDAAFGRKLKENETALHLLGIQKRFRHGSTEWRFDPPSEEAERCKNAYADSARKDDKTWKSEEV